jgi:hypothetical protein
MDITELDSSVGFFYLLMTLILLNLTLRLVFLIFK